MYHMIPTCKLKSKVEFILPCSYSATSTAGDAMRALGVLRDLIIDKFVSVGSSEITF